MSLYIQMYTNYEIENVKKILSDLIDKFFKNKFDVAAVYLDNDSFYYNDSESEYPIDYLDLFDKKKPTRSYVYINVDKSISEEEFELFIAQVNFVLGKENVLIIFNDNTFYFLKECRVDSYINNKLNNTFKNVFEND